jgi:hypothetical protein
MDLRILLLQNWFPFDITTMGLCLRRSVQSLVILIIKVTVSLTGFKHSLQCIFSSPHRMIEAEAAHSYVPFYCAYLPMW